MNKFRQLIIVLVCIMSGNGATFAQTAGELDFSFNGNGYVRIDFNGNTDVINDIAVQPDQKIVAAGVAFTESWNVEVKIIRLLPDGTLDPDFGTGGIVTYTPPVMGYFEAHAMALTIKDDGKILVAGGVLNSMSIFDILLIQLDINGNFDSNFGTNGISVVSVSNANDMAQDVIVNDDGKILVAGTADNAEYNVAPMVARFDENGNLDGTFGTNGSVEVPVVAIDNEFTSICLQSDGKIIASGHFNNENWAFETLIARFTPEGVLDPTFGFGGIARHNVNSKDDEFFGMQITDDHEIVAGGFTTKSNYDFDMLIMKYDSTGTLVSDFGTNGIVTYHHSAYNVIYDIVIQPDEKILAVGSIGEFAPGNNDWALLRYEKNGTPDVTFGNGGITLTDFFGEQDEAQSIALAGNDKIYLGGKTLNTGSGIRDFTVARYTNDLHTLVPEFINGNTSIIPGTTKGTFLVNTTLNHPTLDIYNAIGKKIRTFEILSNSSVIDLSGLSCGICFYQMKSNGQVVEKGKLIVM